MIFATFTCVLALAAPQSAGDGATGEEDPRQTLANAPALSATQGRGARDRAVRWLLDNQREDGSWAEGVMDSVQETFFSVESFYAWKLAADSLACLALASVEETPEIRAALERGVTFLLDARLAQRGSDWDTDYGWSTLYGFVALTELYGDARFQGEEWAGRIEAKAKAYLDLLERLQSPQGGWAYYDDPIFSQRPTWDTSFCTALVLPSLKRAIELGWLEDEGVLERGRRYVIRCAVPAGAYAYDIAGARRGWSGESINRIKGSLGRTQVCNWALRETGSEKITEQRIREGLESFLEHHRFLDVARLRPIPHEAYYANAGYFYMFGHYYAAQAVELLPIEEREGWHARLRPHLVRAQQRDGSALDFITSSYDRVACTAYLVLGLTLGLEGGSR